MLALDSLLNPEFGGSEDAQVLANVEIIINHLEKKV